jgi:hypothetical protein
MSLTLNQINNEYNTNLKTLTNNMNNSIMNAYRVNKFSNNFLINKIKTDYNKNITSLSIKRKTLIKQMGKLIDSALIVGINYTRTNYELYGCINDANNMKQFVSSRGCDKILMMTDNELVKPIKINIMAGLKTLLLNAKDGETVFFYYSGHGTNITDNNGDEVDGKDECIFTLDGQIIIDDDLNNIIKTFLKPKTKLFILCDCCHSGTLFDLKYNHNNETNTIKNIDINGNVYYISGCRDSQVSLETFSNKQSQGALTNAFISSLSEQITWKDFMTILNSKLSEQTPQLSTSKQVDINTEKCFF